MPLLGLLGNMLLSLTAESRPAEILIIPILGPSAQTCSHPCVLTSNPPSCHSCSGPDPALPTPLKHNLSHAFCFRPSSSSHTAPQGHIHYDSQPAASKLFRVSLKSGKVLILPKMCQIFCGRSLEVEKCSESWHCWRILINDHGHI